MAKHDQPQRATGHARLVIDQEDGRLVVRIALSRGDEIGFALGAMTAAGFQITAARACALTVLVGRRRPATVTKVLRAVGFNVNEGGEP